MSFEILEYNRIHDAMADGWTVNSTQTLTAFIEHMRWRFEQKKFIRVELYDAARTIDQNAMTFELYQTIGKTLYGGDTELARCECKLKYGCAIMWRDSDKFRAVYDKVIKPHDYPTKLEIMDLLPVTRLMDRAQISEYIEQVKNVYTSKGVDFTYLDQPRRKAK